MRILRRRLSSQRLNRDLRCSVLLKYPTTHNARIIHEVDEDGA